MLKPTFDFTPTAYASAADKARFAKHFIKFVERGFQQKDFPKWFYHRLSNTFGHIAHFDRDGFYAAQFSTKERQLQFVLNILRHPCWGDPTHTFSDVETVLKLWLIGHALHVKLQAEIDADTETRERATLKHLIEKYGVPA